jgi:hypothetical protein
MKHYKVINAVLDKDDDIHANYYLFKSDSKSTYYKRPSSIDELCYAYPSSNVEYYGEHDMEDTSLTTVVTNN